MSFLKLESRFSLFPIANRCGLITNISYALMDEVDTSLARLTVPMKNSDPSDTSHSNIFQGKGLQLVVTSETVKYNLI